MRKLILSWSILVIACLVTVGCQRSGNGTDTNIVITGGGGTIDTRYLLQEEPPDAKGVLDLKKDAKDGEDIVIVGRVGGRVEPFVKGRTSFTIVDPSLKTCSDKEGDNCTTPWDYCCEHPENLARATVLVKFVD